MPKAEKTLAGELTLSIKNPDIELFDFGKIVFMAKVIHFIFS